LQVLRYLGRYIHRVAILNPRLLPFDGERVTFRWRDCAHGNKSRVLTLHATGFLRPTLEGLPIEEVCSRKQYESGPLAPSYQVLGERWK
jgi:hypothetical protein